MKRHSASFVVWLMVFGGDDLAGGRLFAPQTGAGEDGEHSRRRIRSRGVGQGLSPGVRLLAQEQGPQPAGAQQIPQGLDRRRQVRQAERILLSWPCLFNGWGFGVEYNEIRGHYYMLIDQLEIDPSRLKAGGVCLTCKTPFAPKLMKEMGAELFQRPLRGRARQDSGPVPAHGGDVHRLPRQQDHGPEVFPLDPG